jgi:hypothetical protein
MKKAEGREKEGESRTRIVAIPDMENFINADQFRRYVPKDRKLPGRFDDFVRAHLPLRVEWNDLEAYDLKPSATKEVIPFLRRFVARQLCVGGLRAVLWLPSA